MLTYTPSFLPSDRDVIEVARETADGRALRPVRFVSCDALVYGDYVGAGSVGVANVRVLRDDAALRDYTTTISASRIDNHYLGVDCGREVAFSRMLLVEFGFDTTQAYIREDVDRVGEYTASLSDYPALDDCAVSDVEVEWQQEAVADWAARDLMRTVDAERLADEAAQTINLRDLWAGLHSHLPDSPEYPGDPDDDAFEQWHEAIAEWLDARDADDEAYFWRAAKWVDVNWHYENNCAWVDVDTLTPGLMRTLIADLRELADNMRSIRERDQNILPFGE